MKKWSHAPQCYCTLTNFQYGSTLPYRVLPANIFLRSNTRNACYVYIWVHPTDLFESFTPPCGHFFCRPAMPIRWLTQCVLRLRAAEGYRGLRRVPVATTMGNKQQQAEVVGWAHQYQAATPQCCPWEGGWILLRFAPNARM